MYSFLVEHVHSGAPYLRGNGNLSMPKKIGYDVRVRKPGHTDSGSRGKKLSMVGKGVPDMYVA